MKGQITATHNFSTGSLSIILFPASCRLFLIHLPLRKFFLSIMVYLTRLEHFNAAHKLYNLNWSKEKNEEIFGECANENWHGHNFDLYVTIKGKPDAETGFLMDVKKLKALIKEYVIKK